MFRAAHELLHRCSRPTLIAAGLVASLQVQAADKVALNLPSQSLATSLSQVAQKTRIQLLFDEDQLRSIPARALEGQFTAQQAIGLLLMGGGFKLIQVGNTFVVRQIEPEPAAYKDAIQLGAVSILGDGKEVDSSSVGRSTLTRDDIERSQPSNIPSLLATLPGVSMGGSMKPGGQTINIWGLGDAEDVPLTVDGANKSSFERYQQGTIFIEPELIKSIEVEKGPHSPETGNGGFGGTVHMETKDAPDLLEEGRNSGAMVKYGYASNNHEQTYSGAVYGRTDDGKADGLVFLTQRDGGRGPAQPQQSVSGQSQAHPQHRSGSGCGAAQAEPEPHRRAEPQALLLTLQQRALDTLLGPELPDATDCVQHPPVWLRRRPETHAGQP